MLSKCLQFTTFNKNKTPLLKLRENGNATFPKTAQNVSFQASIYMSPKKTVKKCLNVIQKLGTPIHITHTITPNHIITPSHHT